MNRPLRLAWRALVLFAVLATAAACGGHGTTTSTDPASEFATMFQGYRADYEPAASPAELARRSTLVVLGQIDKVVPGLQYSDTADGTVSYQSTVLQFRVDRVLAGQLPTGAGSLVYVDLPAPLRQTAAAFDR